MRYGPVNPPGGPQPGPPGGERLGEPSRRRIAAQQGRRYRFFVKGPIPLVWLERAARCPGKAPAVTYLLWFKRGMEGPGPFTISHELLTRFGVGRKAANRAYEALEKAGLIAVDRGNGRLPRLAIIDTPTAAQGNPHGERLQAEAGPEHQDGRVLRRVHRP